MSSRASSAAPSFATDVRSALDAFRRIIQALRQASRETERRVGLSAAQLFALQQLANHAGASVNDLAASTFTHQSSVSLRISVICLHRVVQDRPAAQSCHLFIVRLHPFCTFSVRPAEVSHLDEAFVSFTQNA